jgi:hypothetical protein
MGKMIFPPIFGMQTRSHSPLQIANLSPAIHFPLIYPPPVYTFYSRSCESTYKVLTGRWDDLFSWELDFDSGFGDTGIEPAELDL